MLKKAVILPVLIFGIATSVATPAHANVTETAKSAKPLFFAASLSGGNEIPVPGGPAAGDPKGSAKAVVEVDGNRVTFAFSWKGISAPTMGHIHAGAAGVNGDVKVPLFTTAMPETTTAAVGVVEVDDAGLVNAIVSDPADFYLNLHTTQFPAGAVRGQLQAVHHHSDPMNLLRGLPLQGLMDGGQEVPVAGEPAVDDPDGQGISLIRASGHHIAYTFAWGSISEPTMGHIHAGERGTGGPVVVPLFMSPVPEHVYAISGQVKGIDKHLVGSIRTGPSEFYTNLHTSDFPGGAIRGQLTPATPHYTVN